MHTTPHATSVDRFAERGEYAAQRGACPLETWACDLRAVVDYHTKVLASLHQVPAGEARGMALAGLVSGRPGSWEALQVVAMARARFSPLVELAPPDPALSVTYGWHTWQIDGGQVIADALARLTERGPVIPDESHFAQTSFARSTTV